MLPLLSKPALLSAKNRVTHSEAFSHEIWRIIGILLVATLLGILTYSGTLSALNAIGELQAKYPISRERLLDSLLFFLFCTTAMTSAISFIGIFLLSEDLDFLRATPLRKIDFFTGKYVELLASSSWIILFFGTPLLFAYGTHYNHPTIFYINAAITLPLFSALATSIGGLVALCCSLLVPAYRTRDYTLLFALLLIAGSYIGARTVGSTSIESNVLRDIISLSLTGHQTFLSWAPSHIFAHSYALSMQPLSSWKEVLFFMSIIFCLTIGTHGILFFLLRSGYDLAYSKTKNFSTRSYDQIHIFGSIIQGIQKALPLPRKGFLFKEMRLFLRDVTQSIQFMLLLTLCLIYLYNFQRLSFLADIPETVSSLWKSILSLSNIFMGGLLFVALSARFAYPAISLEGKSWWIIRSSGLQHEQVLYEKAFFWWLLFSVPSVTVFLAGTLALELPFALILFHTALGLALSYLFICQGLYYGAKYVTFSWENPAQLTSNLGSFICMFSGCALLILMIIPVTCSTALYALSTLNLGGSQEILLLAFFLSEVLLIRWIIALSTRLIRRAAQFPAIPL